MPQNEQYKHGLLFAFAAYIMWGIAPIYFKALVGIDAIDILLHRVIWSFAFILLMIVAITGFSKIKQLFKTPKKLGAISHYITDYCFQTGYYSFGP